MSSKEWSAGRFTIAKQGDGYRIRTDSELRLLTSTDLADLGLVALAALRARDGGGESTKGLLGLMGEVDDFLGGGTKERG
jgi:hypothetical protein